MKLIKEATAHVHMVTVDIRAPRTLTQFVIGEPGTKIGERQYQGRVSINSCIIDFEGYPVTLGEKIDELVFGKVKYRGVLPLCWNALTGEIECKVDLIELEN